MLLKARKYLYDSQQAIDLIDGIRFVLASRRR